MISVVEDDPDLAAGILDELYPLASNKRTHVIGVSGAPGIGKSTLIDKLAKGYSSRQKRVGVIAVDPSSNFTGGAVLGDRSRMGGLTLDEKIYVRSMGTRGHMGGLSGSTMDAVTILRAFGYDKVIVETTGTGQNEVDVVNAVHTSVVVMMPGLGDGVQMIEAGSPEIGDVFALNKADVAGADATYSELLSMIRLRYTDAPWVPPLVRTVATMGERVDELSDAVESHYAYLVSSGELMKREERMFGSQVSVAVRSHFMRKFDQLLTSKEVYEIVREGMSSGKSPYRVAGDILGKISSDDRLRA